MPSTREIRRRIRSIKNTAQITKAMEMVSASKMRRAQGLVLASRPYAERMAELIAGLASMAPSDDSIDPLLQQRPVANVGLIVITPDRGLCGALVGNTLRQVARYVAEQTVPLVTMPVGRKGRDWLTRHVGNVIAEISGLTDRPTLLDVAPISAVAIEGFRSGRFDRVDLIYNQYVSAVVQRVVRRQLLPIVPPNEENKQLIDYILEPDAATVLSRLLPRYVEVEVYQAVLEAIASEHSARMVAMHSATENAKEITGELTLSYNKARQSSITNEILEVSAGVEALSGS